jgi:hypothetical protein
MGQGASVDVESHTTITLHIIDKEGTEHKETFHMDFNEVDLTVGKVLKRLMSNPEFMEMMAKFYGKNYSTIQKLSKLTVLHKGEPIALGELLEENAVDALLQEDGAAALCLTGARCR